jgi:hypothetical protein
VFVRSVFVLLVVELDWEECLPGRLPVIGRLWLWLNSVTGRNTVLGQFVSYCVLGLERPPGSDGTPRSMWTAFGLSVWLHFVKGRDRHCTGALEAAGQICQMGLINPSLMDDFHVRVLHCQRHAVCSH